MFGPSLNKKCMKIILHCVSVLVAPAPLPQYTLSVLTIFLQCILGIEGHLSPDFSTPSFNSGPFNPRLFNPGFFNHEFLNHGVEKFMVEKSGVEISFNLGSKQYKIGVFFGCDSFGPKPI